MSYVIRGYPHSTDSEDDSDDQIDYVSMIRGLIHRGRLMQLSYEEAQTPIKRQSMPLLKIKPDTTNLEKSEFALSTKIASGSGSLKRKWERNNVTNMVLARQKGVPGNKFSNSDKCKINNEYLPNEMEELHKTTGKVFCGIFSKDGDYFVTAAQDREINVFDTKNIPYRKINTIYAKDVEWSIIDVAFSPSREQLVYSTWNSSLQLCSLHDNFDKQEVLILSNSHSRFCAFCITYSTSGTEIMAGTNDGCVYFYDLQKHIRSLKIRAHTVDTNAVTFATESSQIIYSGGDDGLIKVWDRRTLNEDAPNAVGTLAGHLDGITYIDSRGDGRHLISNSKDQSIKLWDIRAFSSNKAAQTTMKIVQEQPWDYRWQNVPRTMYKEKKIEGDTSIMTYRGHVVVKTLVRCRFSPIATTGQRYIYTGCGLGRVVIYDALTGKIEQQLTGHRTTVRDVSWHPYRNEILSSSWDGVIGFWKYLKVDDLSSEEEDVPSVVDDSAQSPQVFRRSQRIADKRRMLHSSFLRNIT